MAEKAQFTGVNEHFEAIFNAAEATQIVFQQPARKTDGCEPLTAKTLFLKGSDGVRRPIHQRCAACWSEARAFTHTSPSGVRSFFQQGARGFRSSIINYAQAMSSSRWANSASTHISFES